MMFEENFFNKNMMLMKEKEKVRENLILGGMTKREKIYIFKSNHHLTIMISRKNLTENNYKYIMIKSTLIAKEQYKKLRVFLKIIKLGLNLISEDP